MGSRWSIGGLQLRDWCKVFGWFFCAGGGGFCGVSMWRNSRGVQWLTLGTLGLLCFWGWKTGLNRMGLSAAYDGQGRIWVVLLRWLTRWKLGSTVGSEITLFSGGKIGDVVRGLRCKSVAMAVLWRVSALWVASVWGSCAVLKGWVWVGSGDIVRFAVCGENDVDQLGNEVVFDGLRWLQWGDPTLLVVDGGCLGAWACAGCFMVERANVILLDRHKMAHGTVCGSWMWVG